VLAAGQPEEGGVIHDCHRTPFSVAAHPIYQNLALSESFWEIVARCATGRSG